jgi:hypothetical protein
MIYSILFTGHMVDAKGRENPRFPSIMEIAARSEIKNRLILRKEKMQGDLRGIASGACGGDILFHEVCSELGIATEVYLALPMEEFRKKSVSFAGDDWNKRFDLLLSRAPVHVLPPADKDESENVWERTNDWMLKIALKNGGDYMALIALWDGKGGDGEGGTAHMIKMSKQQDATVDIIDVTRLYD